MIFTCILSIIIGFVLGLYVGYLHKYKRHAPNSKLIRKMIFERGNKCYKLKPTITSCGISLF